MNNSKLASGRANGVIPGERIVVTEGEELKVAANNLRNARAAIMRWTSSCCSKSRPLETDLEHIHEITGIAILLARKTEILDDTARLYGTKP